MRILICLIAGAAFALAQGDVEVRTELDAKEIAKLLGSKDVTQRHQAAQAAATVQDGCVLTPLTKLLKDKEQAVREAAIEALRVREDDKDKKKAAQALGSRLKQLSDKEEWQPERVSICNALHDLAQTASIKALLTNVSLKTDHDEVRARLRAVANVPDAEAIEAIFRFASSGKRHSNRAKLGQQALAYATGAKDNKGLDQWRRWWNDHKKDFDFEAAAKQREEQRAADAEREAKRKAKKKKRRNDLGQE